MFIDEKFPFPWGLDVACESVKMKQVLKWNKYSMHETGCLGLVHWDGEGGGRKVQDGEQMNTL